MTVTRKKGLTEYERHAILAGSCFLMHLRFNAQLYVNFSLFPFLLFKLHFSTTKPFQFSSSKTQVHLCMKQVN